MPTAPRWSLTVFEARYEVLAGTHRIQRVPDTEKQGRRHSSLVTIAWFDGTAQGGQVDVDVSDVRVDLYRGSGAGGQHRNKTETCVRLTHPSGVTVVATEQRSKHQNLAVAWQRLSASLQQQAAESAHRALNGTRVASIGEGRRWTWTGWRDEVVGPNGRRTTMKKALAGRLDPLLR